jgi:type IV pilus assembly protein PilC
MPMYAYQARDTQGHAVAGQIEAGNSEEATRQLRAAGKSPTSIKLAAEATRVVVEPSGIKIGREDVIQFSNQLSIMLETGVTLAEALECCALNADKPAVKKLMDDLCAAVNGGNYFSDALAKHPRSFPKLYIALIKASERSGQMSKMLGRATAYLKDEKEILTKVKGALTYPGIMLSFAVLTTIFLLVFVLPKFTQIYAKKGAALPTPTKILMGASDLLIHQWMYIVPAVFAISVGFMMWKKTPSGRRVMDYVMLNVPLLGPMFRKLHLARGLRTIGTMAGSGVSLVECVDTARELSANSYFTQLWNDVHDQITNGNPFSQPLSQSKLVPASMTRMLASGEKGGKLAMVMEQVSTFAEHELKEKIHELTRYIEPAMIAIMGVLIGGVTMALLLPVFRISSVVSQ